MFTCGGWPNVWKGRVILVLSVKYSRIDLVDEQVTNSLTLVADIDSFFLVLHSRSWLSKYSICLRSDLISNERSSFPSVNVTRASSSANSSRKWLGEEEVVLLLKGLITSGTPWTEEEHRLFLLGLQKLGKGDWRGIARNYVLSRTPTQAEESPEDQFMLPPAPGADHPNNDPCSLKLSLNPDSDQSMEAAAPTETLEQDIREETSTVKNDQLPSIIMPAFYPAYIPIPFAVWPSTMTPLEEPTNNNNTGSDGSYHWVLKPIPLSLKDTDHHYIEPSSLSLKLMTEPSRQSAFHASTPAVGSSAKDKGVVWPSTMTPLEEPTNNNNTGSDGSYHRVLKPIPVSSKEPMNLDELVGKSSQLSLKDTDHHYIEPSSLSLKLMTEPSRQSAFHASTPAVGSSAKDKGVGNGFRAI
nr:transcription factor MYBS3 [Tanacetum cinerariifolium]